MCGGTLEIATCSHVGHVFRKSTPYTFPGGTSKIVNHNNARLAEVWLDQWKYFYYNINPGSTNTSWRIKKKTYYYQEHPRSYALVVLCDTAHASTSRKVCMSPYYYLLFFIINSHAVAGARYLSLSDTR